MVTVKGFSTKNPEDMKAMGELIRKKKLERLQEDAAGVPPKQE